MLRITSLICLSIFLTANAERLYSEEPLIGTVTGTVVSESGSPVAGADVLVLLDGRPDLVSSPQQLLVRGPTDRQGRFAVPVPGSLVFNGAIHRCDEIQIWAAHPEEGWTVQRSEGQLPAADLSLQLNNPEPENLTVLAPDGSPASGIEVSVQEVRVAKDFIRVPDFLSHWFTATTDRQGKVELPGVSRKELLCTDFHSKTFGTQRLYWLSDKQFAEEVTLRPVASLTGRVTGDLPAGRLYEELSVTLSTKPLVRDYDFPTQLGTAHVQVQADGTFTVPRLATGLLEIEAEFPDDFPAFAVSPEGLYVSENSTVRVALPLQHAKRFTGRTIDAETKEPIPDVRVFLKYGTCRPARTDAQGNFILYCAPAGNYPISFRPPEPYHAPPAWVSPEISISQDATGFELLPLELIRGETLSGTVKDSKGNPVSGVGVTVYWDDRLSSERRQLRTLSDDQGRFEFPSVNPHAPLVIRAMVERVSVNPSTGRKKLNEIPQPLELTVDPGKRVALSGRIVDEDGQPVPNADYQISVMLDEESYARYEVVGAGLKLTELYPYRTVEKAHSGKTDAAGEFLTPKEFFATGIYHLYPMVDGSSVGHSGPLQPDASGTGRFNDAVQELTKRSFFPKKPKYNAPSSVSFSVLVTNQQGDVVPDAKVVVWTLGKRLQLRTDKQGRFHMPQVFKPGLWVFVDAEGYRFFGEFVKPAGIEHRITLVRTEEPAGEAMKTITDTVNEDVLAQARQDFMKFMEHCHELGDSRRKHELMGLIPKLDPDLGMSCLEDPRFDASDMGKASNRDSHRNRVRWAAAMRYVKSDVRKAAEAARSMTLSNYRVWGLCAVARALPAGEQQLRADLLSDALSTARAIEDSQERIEALYSVASAMIDLGEAKRGQIVLYEVVRLAQKPLPENLDERLVESANAYRAFIARKLALYDLPAALKLIPEAKKEYTIGRYYGGVAEAVADVKPADAVRILEQFPEARGGWSVRVCYRMAKADYERARKLSEAINNPSVRFYCWGVMAHVIADEDPQKARELLDEAFNELGTLVDAGQRGGNSSYTPLKAALSLLPVVEQVDPDRLREYFWRALSFRQNANIGKEMSGLDYLGTDPVLGAFLVRYDRKVAEVLVRRDYDWLSPNVDEWEYFLFGGLAALDPAEAVHLVSQLPEKTDYDRTLKLEAWNEIVPLLVNRGKDGWNYLKDNQYLFREIDDLGL